MPKSTPTIAQVVTIHTMTDGSIRICEFSTIAANAFSCEPLIYCETPADAIEYISACDLLSVNPAWYGEGAANG